MLQVNKKVINKIISASLITVLSAGVAVNGSYLNTNRDTRKAPERSKSAMSVSSAFEKYMSLIRLHIIIEKTEIYLLLKIRQQDMSGKQV